LIDLPRRLTDLPFVRSWSTRRLAASMTAFPRRIIPSAHLPSACRPIGARLSGNTPGIGGKLPVRSSVTRNRLRIAS
jgi:hypothetical protein